MISVTILVKNGERHLSKVLASLPFPEIIVFDTGSEDNTLAIAHTFPHVRVFKEKFIGFGPSHNAAAALATHDWILSIDADEILSDALQAEILSLPLNPTCVYAINRLNHFNGKKILWCGWHPDPCIRLYNRTQTRFSEALVHEGVLKGGLKVQPLRSPLLHYPYETLSDFLHKMELYSSLFAAGNRGKKSSPLKACAHSLFAFFKSYILKRGFCGGYEGFFISRYNAQTAFYKYLKLYHLNQHASHIQPPPHLPSLPKKHP